MLVKGAPGNLVGFLSWPSTQQRAPSRPTCNCVVSAVLPQIEEHPEVSTTGANNIVPQVVQPTQPWPPFRFLNDLRADSDRTDDRITLPATAKRTCDEYFRLGERRSGVWIIDVDGSGPQHSSHVTCQMGMRKNNDLVAVTWVDHNLRSGTPARGINISDHRSVVTYRYYSMSHWRPILRLSSRRSIFKSSHCNSFEYCRH